jgi:hypothetical protein
VIRSKSGTQIARYPNCDIDYIHRGFAIQEKFVFLPASGVTTFREICLRSGSHPRWRYQKRGGHLDGGEEKGDIQN